MYSYQKKIASIKTIVSIFAYIVFTGELNCLIEYRSCDENGMKKEQNRIFYSKGLVSGDSVVINYY